MRALIIDDEADVRDTLAESLRAACFAVDTASDGMEGSYLARTNAYDIIILDNMLPEKSGTTVCQEIRRTGRACPILVLSVLSDTWRKVDLLNDGADDYLTKPFSFEELMARIRALMASTSSLRVPAESRTAMSSCAERALGPCASRRSRGFSSLGRSRTFSTYFLWLTPRSRSLFRIA